VRFWNYQLTRARLRGPLDNCLSSPAMVERVSLELAPDRIEAQRTIGQLSVLAGDDRKSDPGTSSRQNRGSEDHFAIGRLRRRRSKERPWNWLQAGARLRGPFRDYTSSPATIERATLELAPDRTEDQRTISQLSVFAGDDRKSDPGTSSRQDRGSEDHFTIVCLRWRRSKERPWN
jgi:hypothetical protein